MTVAAEQAEVGNTSDGNTQAEKCVVLLGKRHRPLKLRMRVSDMGPLHYACVRLQSFGRSTKLSLYAIQRDQKTRTARVLMRL